MDIRADLEAVSYEFDEAADRLIAILQHIRYNGPQDPLIKITMQNNIIVALCSTAEESIRNLFQEYLRILEETHPKHNFLRKELQVANMEGALAELNAYKKLKAGGDKAKAVAVVKNLKACLSGEGSYELLKAKITYNQGNFKTSQISQIAKKVGIQGIIGKICDCEEIREWTNEEEDENRVNKFTVEWNEIFDERDLIVHRLSSANGWGIERIHTVIRLAKIIVERLRETLIADASEVVEKVEARMAAEEA